MEVVHEYCFKDNNMKSFREYLAEEFSVKTLFDNFKKKIRKNFAVLLTAGMLAAATLNPTNANAEFSTPNQMNNLVVKNGVNTITDKWEKTNKWASGIIQRKYNQMLNEVYDLYNDYRFQAHTLNQQGKITIDDVKKFLDTSDNIIIDYVDKIKAQNDTDEMMKLYNQFKKDIDKEFNKMSSKADTSDIDLKNLLKTVKFRKPTVPMAKEFKKLISELEKKNNKKLNDKVQKPFLLGIAEYMNYVDKKGKITNETELRNLINNYFRDLGAKEKAEKKDKDN